jgi:hypothetical protein
MHLFYIKVGGLVYLGKSFKEINIIITKNLKKGMHLNMYL